MATISAIQMVILYRVIDTPRNRSGQGPFKLGLPLYTHHFPEIILFMSISPIVRALIISAFSAANVPLEPIITIFPFIVMVAANVVQFLERKDTEKRLSIVADPVSAYLTIFVLLDLAFFLGYFLG